jgi:hypothetical protein
MICARTAYYNPALPIANGQHWMDTSRRLQDHQIVLLPAVVFKVFAGYSRNTQSGAALSTVNLFDQQRGTSSRYLPTYGDYKTNIVSGLRYSCGGEVHVSTRVGGVSR